jgi:hypothetical protein
METESLEAKVKSISQVVSSLFMSALVFFAWTRQQVLLPYMIEPSDTDMVVCVKFGMLMLGIMILGTAVSAAMNRIVLFFMLAKQQPSTATTVDATATASHATTSAAKGSTSSTTKSSSGKKSARKID